MKFGAHYLPTYVPDLDGPYPEFYRRMFEQAEELDKLGFDHIWVTEHHFGDYGGSIPHPPTFLSAVARGTRRIRLGVAISVLPLHNPVEVAESYAMVDVISNGRLDFGVGKGKRAARIPSVESAPGGINDALKRGHGNHPPGMVGRRNQL